MTDDLDDELLALAGDSEEEHSPQPEDKDGSPRHSRTSHSPPTSQMSRKDIGRRGSRKGARDDHEEDGEV